MNSYLFAYVAAGGKTMAQQDPSKQFTEDLATLNSDERLPNARIKEVRLRDR